MGIDVGREATRIAARIGLWVPARWGMGARLVDIDQGGELVVAGVSYEIRGVSWAVGCDLAVVIRG